jgi:hypothetical protein
VAVLHVCPDSPAVQLISSKLTCCGVFSRLETV